ncbi:phosphoribosylglycinamide formyltransferase [Oceanispirochaeta crateris]|uniref:Phosphoribosylglycinamide formyltransferase n=1 Tax=Oceanispirochaeta crateris TaxID=2518645 RepID=A0A5C1QJP9_9SPIO|nr:phosphoribosylglycinamide formyltransferase [Oceanispirochaeta crateris]QEN07389.1 phosphoribosylglycinamide formyltransferase [Oceanispirochaeta crateris]
MFKIVVLVSGGGSNLQSLLDAVKLKKLQAEIIAVIADRPAYALVRAGNSNIDSFLIERKTWGTNLSEKILEKIPKDTDLIVLAGFLSILSPSFINRWSGRIINIHPSLLPDFGGKGMHGMKVHQAVILSGCEKSGCSVHSVDAGIDTGEVILQREVPVLKSDSPESLQKRILEEEHILIVDAVDRIIKKSEKNLKQGRE